MQPSPLFFIPVRQSLSVWLLAAVLFAAAFTLITRENQFPYYYHPDEPGKVAQVQTGKWNFNHPMVMLITGRLAAKTTGDLENPQRVVEVGRAVSAFFFVFSVLLLAAMTWITAGRFAGTAVGLLLLTNHQLFELAHYFKEDTALLFGISVWFLALALYWKRPHAGTAALLGTGAALALSGKYVGVFALLLSFWLIPQRAPAGRRGSLIGVFLGAFAVVFALVNLPLLLQLGTFETSLHRELTLVAGDQKHLTRSIPHSVYLSSFRENISFVLWPFVLWHFVACWQRRKELTAFEWVATLFPVAYLVMLSFSPKTNDRYFLPCTALFLYTVALGMGRMARQLWGCLARFPSRWIAPALLALALFVQITDRLPSAPGLIGYYRAFRVDDIADLTLWLNTHLPNAILAKDRKVQLPTPERAASLPNAPVLIPKIVGKGLDNLPAGLDDLRASGVTHVVLSESSYGRFFLKSLRSQKSAETSKSRDLYRALRSEKPLWERPRGTVIYLHPGLEVYPLPASS